jgi:hypothetical protein
MIMTCFSVLPVLMGITGGADGFGAVMDAEGPVYRP